eukprot:1190444-Prorocentrum_minimum.AAC.3
MLPPTVCQALIVGWLTSYGRDRVRGRVRRFCCLHASAGPPRGRMRRISPRPPHRGGRRRKRAHPRWRAPPGPPYEGRLAAGGKRQQRQQREAEGLGDAVDVHRGHRRGRAAHHAPLRAQRGDPRVVPAVRVLPGVRLGASGPASGPAEVARGVAQNIPPSRHPIGPRRQEFPPSPYPIGPPHPCH